MRMIKKIKKIDGFRCFKPFIWDEDNCELFGRVNIIYGWNGTGKSTLSTFFHHFEKKTPLSTPVTLDLSYQNGDAQMCKFSSQPSEATLCPICVFYDKYIEENLKKHDGIKPIFVIGKEQSYKVEEIASLASKIDVAEKKHTKLESSLSLARKEYDDYCKKQASLIKNEAKLTAAYNKNTYESDCTKDFISTKKEEYETAKTAITAEQRKEIRLSEPQAIDQTLLNKLEKLFEESPIHKALDELKHNSTLSAWIFQGLRLHSIDDSICKFCGSPITNMRRTDLENHFNRSYNTCVENLSKINSYLSIYAQQLELYCQQLPSSDSLYVEFREEYEKAVEDLRVAIRTDVDLCRTVCGVIDRKRMDIINTTYADEYRAKWKTWIDLASVVSKVVDIVAKHNKRCNDNSSYVSAAKETIKKYWISVTHSE